MPSDSNYERPDYPKILTKKNWDKEKGVWAKMHGKTGIGAQLEKLETSYKAIDWDAVEMVKNRGPLNKFKLSEWDAKRKAAEKEVKGNMKKFSETCYKTRDLADGVAKEFKKSKTIPKSATKLATDIAKQADFMGVGANMNSMGSRIIKMYDFGRAPLDTLRDVVIKKLPGLTDKAIKIVGEAKKTPTKDKYNDLSVRDAVRDVTQNVGNMPKLVTAGYPVGGIDAATCKKLTKTLALFGDSQGQCPDSWGDDPSETTIKKDLTKLEATLKAVKVMCDNIKKS
ncbi:MAG: hypothetical protein AAGI17_00595 [Planctomycetota bacterium]